MVSRRPRFSYAPFVGTVAERLVFRPATAAQFDHSGLFERGDGNLVAVHIDNFDRTGNDDRSGRLYGDDDGALRMAHAV